MFYECANLRSISLPEGLRRIESCCFFESGLEEITIPSSVTALEDHAFTHCHRLKRVVFQSDSELEQISDSCFFYCGLKKFIAPPGLKKIGGRAFYACESLRRVVLNEGLEVLKDHCGSDPCACLGVFQDSGIEEIALPSTLWQIGYYVVFHCDSLRTIYMKRGCKADLSRLLLPESAQIVRIPD